MIDPAIADFARHMETPPAIVRPALSYALSPTSRVARAEQAVRHAEQRADRWDRMARAGLQHVQQVAQNASLTQENVEFLRGMLEVLDTITAKEVVEFARQKKRGRRAVRGLVTSPPEMQEAAVHLERNLNAASRMNTTRVEIAFGLRALIATLDGKAERGPVFTDARALGDALRAALR